MASKNLRRVLLATLIVVAGGAATGVGVGLFTYHEATKIDRSNAKVVLDNYLRATLVNKDEVGAKLYVCDDTSRLGAMRDLRDEIDRRERDFGVAVIVNWGAMRQTGDQLATDLSIAGTKDGTTISRRTETWLFDMKEEDGWRVCGAEKVAAPSPSASASPSVGASSA